MRSQQTDKSPSDDSNYSVFVLLIAPVRSYYSRERIAIVILPPAHGLHSFDRAELRLRQARRSGVADDSIRFDCRAMPPQVRCTQRKRDHFVYTSLITHGIFHSCRAPRRLKPESQTIDLLLMIDSAL